MDVISSRAQFLSDRIKFLSFQTIKGKLASYYLGLIKGNATIIEVPDSQNSLADLFGVARPSLARAIRELHNDGIIEAKGKNITVLDKRALQQLISP